MVDGQEFKPDDKSSSSSGSDYEHKYLELAFNHAHLLDEREAIEFEQTDRKPILLEAKPKPEKKVDAKRELKI